MVKENLHMKHHWTLFWGEPRPVFFLFVFFLFPLASRFSSFYHLPVDLSASSISPCSPPPPLHQPSLRSLSALSRTSVTSDLSPLGCQILQFVVVFVPMVTLQPLHLLAFNYHLSVIYHHVISVIGEQMYVFMFFLMFSKFFSEAPPTDVGVVLWSGIRAPLCSLVWEQQSLISFWKILTSSFRFDRGREKGHTHTRTHAHNNSNHYSFQFQIVSILLHPPSLTSDPSSLQQRVCVCVCVCVCAVFPQYHWKLLRPAKTSRHLSTFYSPSPPPPPLRAVHPFPACLSNERSVKHH